MAESRITKAALKLEGWKRSRRKVVALCLLCLAALASGWEEGDDSVNVISVENLDALLGLRMVTELNLKNLSAPAERARRGVPRQTSDDLCEKRDCDCDGESISCSFQTEEDLRLGHGALSPRATRLAVSNLARLAILPGAFHDNPRLASVLIEGVSNVSVGSDAFPILGNGRLNLRVTNCTDVRLEDRALMNVADVRAEIDACERVSLGKSAFSPKLELRVSNVEDLAMENSTFYVGRRADRGSTAATIIFQSVTVKKVPSWSFKMNGARIMFVECNIGAIEKEAFKSLQLEGAHFRGTRIARMESEAFSAPMSTRDVELNGAVVDYIAGQVLSVATNLTIHNSSVREISDGAFNVNAAFLRLTQNKFRRMGRHAFVVQSWNSIVIDGNEFESLKQDTFLAPFSEFDKTTDEFVFSGNLVNATEVNALSFVPSHDGLDVVIGNNTFREQCHCRLESWMATLSSERWQSFYDTSNCLVGEFGSCFDLEGEYMRMRNYTATVCGSALANADCVTSSSSSSSSSVDDEFPTESDFKNTERTILGVVFLGVACSIAIMLSILSFTWMKQKGACGEMKRCVTPSGPCCFAVSRMFNSSNLVTSSSISRINIHEYAEIQYQMTDQQKQAILTGTTGEEEVVVVVICEDKATQTLPEELTQELLQSLREKLDDPENYNEARNMIEHLYDLIKVEESCNNNNVSRTSLLLDDDDDEDDDDGGGDEDPDAGGNIYDVIAKKPRRRSKRVRKSVAATSVRSTGTRAPSPDKLSPVAFNVPRVPVVTDYAEPRDRKSNEYCELPETRDAVMPDVLGTSARQIYSTPAKKGNMENRPLPSKPDAARDE